MALKTIKQTASKLKDETPKPSIDGTLYSIVFGTTAVIGLLSFGIYKLLTPERVIARKAKATVAKHRQAQ
ncbi:hypothetical protein ACFQ5J_07670 [Lacticaseibacillus baoqingensis]|uniref:Uncharacterized protein n=1 Tax=Lacticaseibacillus baoqingensis TaxID=2486013 RepID=A0ABW4E5C7_9LACO|nr:hypothetical protein [Lacticaseibacillus baoqingensis]